VEFCIDRSSIPTSAREIFDGTGYLTLWISETARQAFDIMTDVRTGDLLGAEGLPIATRTAT